MELTTAPTSVVINIGRGWGSLQLHQKVSSQSSCQGTSTQILDIKVLDTSILNQPMFLIGVVGENGAGKSSFAKRIQQLADGQLAVEVHKFSEILAQTLDQWGIAKSRRNLQELPRVMEIGFGQGVLSQAARPMIEHSQADIFILDGVRWQTDYDLVRSFDQNLLIYITADPHTRFARLRQRGEKHGEHAMTKSQFDQEEQAVSEQSIPEIGQKADVRLINDGSSEQFITAVDDFYNQHLRQSKL